jgi:cation:H+ antiporter
VRPLLFSGWALFSRSEVTALFIGQQDVGVGIIIGSSIFNIAALLGLSALVVGSLPLSRKGITVNGMTSFIVILVLISGLKKNKCAV